LTKQFQCSLRFFSHSRVSFLFFPLDSFSKNLIYYTKNMGDNNQAVRLDLPIQQAQLIGNLLNVFNNVIPANPNAPHGAGGGHNPHQNQVAARQAAERQQVARNALQEQAVNIEQNAQAGAVQPGRIMQGHALMFEQENAASIDAVVQRSREVKTAANTVSSAIHAVLVKAPEDDESGDDTEAQEVTVANILDDHNRPRAVIITPRFRAHTGVWYVLFQIIKSDADKYDKILAHHLKVFHGFDQRLPTEAIAAYTMLVIGNLILLRAEKPSLRRRDQPFRDFLKKINHPTEDFTTTILVDDPAFGRFFYRWCACLVAFKRYCSTYGPNHDGYLPASAEERWTDNTLIRSCLVQMIDSLHQYYQTTKLVIDKIDLSACEGDKVADATNKRAGIDTKAEAVKNTQVLEYINMLRNVWGLHPAAPPPVVDFTEKAPPQNSRRGRSAGKQGGGGGNTNKPHNSSNNHPPNNNNHNNNRHTNSAHQDTNNRDGTPAARAWAGEALKRLRDPASTFAHKAKLSAGNGAFNTLIKAFDKAPAGKPPTAENVLNDRFGPLLGATPKQ
jgi:hypothetical protein